MKVFRSMRDGSYDEAELERQLNNRGLMFRFFGKWMRSITKEWQMYPVGVVFGLGFDTATEVALLATTALLASKALPWYSIMCLPILFTAGMSLLDTLDGCFMNMAYGWAFLNPVRRIYYNLTITGLSIAICFFIGTIEVLGLASPRTSLEGCLLALHGELQHQRRGFHHRGHVHPHLGRGDGGLEVRARRGKVDIQTAANGWSRGLTRRQRVSLFSRSGNCRTTDSPPPGVSSNRTCPWSRPMNPVDHADPERRGTLTVQPLQRIKEHGALAGRQPGTLIDHQNLHEVTGHASGDANGRRGQRKSTRVRDDDRQCAFGQQSDRSSRAPSHSPRQCRGGGRSCPRPTRRG